MRAGSSFTNSHTTAAAWVTLAMVIFELAMTELQLNGDNHPWLNNIMSAAYFSLHFSQPPFSILSSSAPGPIKRPGPDMICALSFNFWKRASAEAIQ
jgi:hypothetical protein